MPDEDRFISKPLSFIQAAKTLSALGIGTYNDEFLYFTKYTDSRLENLYSFKPIPLKTLSSSSADYIFTELISIYEKVKISMLKLKNVTSLYNKFSQMENMKALVNA